MDECCFSGDCDRGRITEDRSGQMDEEIDGKEKGGIVDGVQPRRCVLG